MALLAFLGLVTLLAWVAGATIDRRAWRHGAE